MPIDNINILFIEDDKDQLRTVPVDLKNKLGDRGIASEIIAVDNIDEGIQKLESESFDLVIVDLRFDGKNRNGNDVLEIILQERLVPIIVYSGYRGDLSKKFAEHGFIYVAEAKRVPILIDQIMKWNEGEVFDFFTEEGVLARKLKDLLRETMWEHVSSYWAHIVSDDQEFLQGITIRLVAKLLHEKLSNATEFAGESGEVLIHHGEIYIFNTPRKHLAAGDIIELNDGLYLILSPTCDLVIRSESGAKAEKILLAHCHDFREYVSETEDISTQINTLMESGKTSNKFKDAKSRIERMMRQSWMNDTRQYFFLPPFANFKGCVVDFLNARVEEHRHEEIDNLLERRVVSLDREMAAELITNFASYMIRLGQPAFKSEPLIKNVVDMFE